MKVLRLPLALLFFAGALTFAYFYVTRSPWYGLHPNGKPPPGAGPTAAQLKHWRETSLTNVPKQQEQLLARAKQRHKQTAAGESKKGGE